MVKKVLVGMSGGIDSAVTSLLLKKEGYDIIGLFLTLSGPDDSSAQQQARELAQKLNIDFEIFDGRNFFSNNVITEILSEYQEGRTPNPCVLCNPSVKFKLLFSVAKERGIPYVATGHYAQIVKNGDKYCISRGVDERKDQSYMLYRLPQEWLPFIIFPLGSLRKTDVRELAKQSFPSWIVQKQESQDVCFAPQGLADFLMGRLDRRTCRSGSIVDEKGRTIGEHQGLWRYTIGQRKGLGLPNGPWFVIAKDMKKNVLHVSRNNDISLLRIRCQNPVFHCTMNNETVYMAEHRYRTHPFPVVLERQTEEFFEVRSLEKGGPVVAPGQSLVLYNKNIVCGGGIIISSEEVPHVSE